MTIIAAVHEGPKALLIGSDTEANDNGYRLPGHHKLHEHPAMALAWGCSGLVTVGDRFTDWFQSQTFQTWAALATAARDALADLNGESRGMARRSGMEVTNTTPNLTAEVVIAGWLQAKADIVGLNDQGEMWNDEDKSAACGTGRQCYRVAMHTMAEIGGIEPLKAFRVALKVTAERAPNCGLPTEIWRVTKDAAAEIPA